MHHGQPDYCRFIGKNGDEQIITESLANYYEEHGQSFEELVIPEHLNARLKSTVNGQ